MGITLSGPQREKLEAMRPILEGEGFSEDDLSRLAKMYVKANTKEDYRDFAAAKVRETDAYWSQDFDRVRTSRGISREVWEARPYLRWPDPLTRDWSRVALPDTSAVKGAYWRLNTNQRGFMTRLARQSPGWIITRHAVPGAPHVWAEIRPDSKVETGPPIRHWHGRAARRGLRAGRERPRVRLRGMARPL